VDLKRRKEEGTAVSEFLSSGTWRVVIEPRIQTMMADGIDQANENVDSHPKMIQGLTWANAMKGLMDWLHLKALDKELDIDSPAATGPDITQDE
jgi:hypothetical protein